MPFSSLRPGPVVPTMSHAIRALGALLSAAVLASACAPDACVPQLLSSTPGLYLPGVAVDANNVYWTTGNSLLKCALGGCNGQPTTLVSGLGNAVAVATDGVN